MKNLGWPAALIIGITILVVELTPIVLGTGEKAIVDWGLFYVTFRFILLPVACTAHVVANVVFLVLRLVLVVRRGHSLSETLVSFSSVVISFGFLLFSYLHPLPLFAVFMGT